MFRSYQGTSLRNLLRAMRNKVRYCFVFFYCNFLNQKSRLIVVCVCRVFTACLPNSVSLGNCKY